MSVAFTVMMYSPFTAYVVEKLVPVPAGFDEPGADHVMVTGT